MCQPTTTSNLYGCSKPKLLAYCCTYTICIAICTKASVTADCDILHYLLACFIPSSLCKNRRIESLIPCKGTNYVQKSWGQRFWTYRPVEHRKQILFQFNSMPRMKPLSCHSQFILWQDDQCIIQELAHKFFTNNLNSCLQSGDD